MTRRSRIARVVVGLALLLGVAAFLLMVYQDQTWVETPPYERQGQGAASTLVVHYSRSGHTFGAAKAAAGYFDAEMLGIDAPQYARSIEGQQLAIEHARGKVMTTAIEHEAVHLADYELVVLCSPTWLFRPAPPLWSFVENHDFAGAAVFLLMTGNSRYEQENIDLFRDLVTERGGRFVGNLFIERGRIYWQKTSLEVHEEVRRELEARSELWPAP